MSRFRNALFASGDAVRNALDWLRTSADPRDVAICTVHGNSPSYDGQFAREFAWPALQMAQLRRHTLAGYTVFAFGNELMPEHEAFLRGCPEVQYFSSAELSKTKKFTHVWPLRNWLTRKAILTHRVIVHLDSDAFPVADDWLNRTAQALSHRSPVIAVQRLENGDAFSDRCFLSFTRAGFHQHAFDFSHVGYRDAGEGISTELERRGFRWKAMLRSNRHNYHPLIAGLYDDMIYHHAAGSREPMFRMNRAQRRADDSFLQREIAIHKVLMRRLFQDTDRFLAELKGQVPPHDLDDALTAELARANVPTASHM